MTGSEIGVSVVVPVYNEEENIRPLYEILKPVMEGLVDKWGPWEVLFIDDGSTDETFKILKDLKTKNKGIRIIRFRKNYGQTAAMNAGFENARGKIVISMDGDLQNDPRDIPLLLETMEKGYDVVSGWRHDRKDLYLSKTLPSRFSNWLARKLLGVKIHDSGCSLKAYSKEALTGLVLFGEMHRYVPALLSMSGFSIGEVKVTHKKRLHGKSKYGFGRLLKGFFDLVYIKFWSSYSTRPLHFFGLIGAIQLIFGAIIGFYKVVISLGYHGKPLEAGPLLLLSVLLVIMGIQFITFGFLGEIQIRTYYNTVGEPNYKIGEILD